MKEICNRGERGRYESSTYVERRLTQHVLCNAFYRTHV